MPELFGIDLPIWVLAILFLLSNKNATDFFKRILAIFGIIAKQDKEAEADERQYQRSRESEMFAVLKSIIDSGQIESKERDKILSNLAIALHKNTDMLSRQIDMLRTLAYNASVADEKLDEIRNHVMTRRLG